jgi:hypothetical protein
MVKTLVEAGVKRIYGIGGDSLNGIIDAIRREGSIQSAGNSDYPNSTQGIAILKLPVSSQKNESPSRG